MKTPARWLLYPAASLTLASLTVTSCSLFNKRAKSAGMEGCPSSTEEVARLDWGLLDPENLDVKAGLMTSIQLDLLAGSMNEELIDACGALARQLFATDEQLTPTAEMMGAEADQACKVVDESLAKLKEIAGGRVVIQAGVPLCSAPLTAADECFAACRTQEEKKDPGKMPPLPVLSCEGELSGACQGICSGRCTLEGDSDCTGSCGGVCAGSCDSEFTGTCNGKCEGRCDGEEINGECSGTCQGRCLEGASGTCGGTCEGSCEGACTMQAEGTCGGVCAGECNKPLTQRRCTGYLRLPSEVNDCQKTCDAAILSQTSCTAPIVKIRVEEPDNAEAANLIERALGQHLPEILKARALNLEQARVEQATSRGKEDMQRMSSLKDQTELALTAERKSCVEDKARLGKESAEALPILFSAATTAQMATASE